MGAGGAESSGENAVIDARGDGEESVTFLAAGRAHAAHVTRDAAEGKAAEQLAC